MRDYKLTSRQSISSILIVIVFAVLYYLPSVISRHMNGDLIAWLTSPPGSIIYLFSLVLGLLIIDRYYIGFLGGPIQKEQEINITTKHAIIVLALIPLIIIIVLGVLSLFH